jgi:hypothetical protein
LFSEYQRESQIRKTIKQNNAKVSIDMVERWGLNDFVGLNKACKVVKALNRRCEIICELTLPRIGLRYHPERGLRVFWNVLA